MSSKNAESSQEDLNTVAGEQKCFWVFGPYTLSATELLGPEGKLVWRKTPKFSVLLELVRAEGKLVAKETLLQAAWGPMAADNNLFTAISDIRNELAAGLKNFKGYEDRAIEDLRASVIENKSGEGYRLRIPVKQFHGERLAIIPATDAVAAPQPGKPAEQNKALVRLPRKFLAVLLPVLILLLVGYAGLRWYVFDCPGQTIYEFYDSLSQAKGEAGVDHAWSLLSPKFQEAFSPGPSADDSKKFFEDGFKRTLWHRNVTVSYVGPKANPFAAMFGDFRVYEVTFQSHDIFREEDLKNANLGDDLLWLEISHPDDIEFLKKAQLPPGTHKIELSRTGRRQFTLVRINGRWLISGIRHLEDGFVANEP